MFRCENALSLQAPASGRVRTACSNAAKPGIQWDTSQSLGTRLLEFREKRPIFVYFSPVPVPFNSNE
jgi:hypothetical protein